MMLADDSLSGVDMMFCSANCDVVMVVFLSPFVAAGRSFLRSLSSMLCYQIVFSCLLGTCRLLH